MPEHPAVVLQLRTNKMILVPGITRLKDPLRQGGMGKHNVCGMPQQETWWQAQLQTTKKLSILWHSHQMASGLCQAV